MESTLDGYRIDVQGELLTYFAALNCLSEAFQFGRFDDPVKTTVYSLSTL